MFPRFRRTFYGKFTIFGLVIIYFVIFYKVSTINLDGNQNNDLESHINLRNKFFNIFASEYRRSVNEFSYEIIIQDDLKKQVIGLGDGGVPVKLKGKAKRRGDAQLKLIALNEELSEQLSYNRILLDARNPLCKNRTYDLNNLPTTSVIIIYYNQPYSIILRTVHSVLRTTNERLLKEIILVDDGSTNVELKEKLNYYVETRLPKNVKILAIQAKHGITYARLAGARLATGDILLFLDAHCECNIGWLEPLAHRIKESRTSVLVPIIDIINTTSFEYEPHGNAISFDIGGFDWNGHFNWIDIPKFERDRIKRECNYNPQICPTNTPTMSGGLFAINREYFWEIGSYDEQMTGWGGENLEISFRIWQCGGTIETIPCSRIGHYFGTFMRHTNGNDDLRINSARMAEVWMDEYSNIFYMIRPELKNNYKIGNVTSRKMLREKLKCKSFKWFLKNVYPQKFIPTENVQGYGRFRSNNLCLDDLQQDNTYINKLGLFVCIEGKLKESQFFSLTNNGIIRGENTCVIVKENSFFDVLLVPCKNPNKNGAFWYYIHGNLIHIRTGLCLESYRQPKIFYVELNQCDRESETQKWIIEHEIK